MSIFKYSYAAIKKKKKSAYLKETDCCLHLSPWLDARAALCYSNFILFLFSMYLPYITIFYWNIILLGDFWPSRKTYHCRQVPSCLPGDWTCENLEAFRPKGDLQSSRNRGEQEDDGDSVLGSGKGWFKAKLMLVLLCWCSSSKSEFLMWFSKVSKQPPATKCGLSWHDPSIPSLPLGCHQPGSFLLTLGGRRWPSTSSASETCCLLLLAHVAALVTAWRSAQRRWWWGLKPFWDHVWRMVVWAECPWPCEGREAQSHYHPPSTQG